MLAGSNAICVFFVLRTMEEGKRQDEHDEESNEDAQHKKRNNTPDLPWSAKDNSMTRENLTDKRWLLSRLPATLPMVFSLAGLLPWSLLIAGLSTYSFIIHKSNQNNRYKNANFFCSCGNRFDTRVSHLCDGCLRVILCLSNLRCCHYLGIAI